MDPSPYIQLSYNEVIDLSLFGNIIFNNVYMQVPFVSRERHTAM